MDSGNIPIAGKIPINRVADFVLGIIPGATAVYIYYLANPAAFQGFLASHVFGYRTKLCFEAGFCLIVGQTLTLFVDVLGGALWGALWGGIGSYLALKMPRVAQPASSAPWQESNWRILAMRYLGDIAPADTMPIPDEEVQARLDAASAESASDHEEMVRQLRLQQQKCAADDGKWRQWYAYFDDQLRKQRLNDFSYAIGDAIRRNLQATGVYVAGSLFFVPGLRQWMWVTFAIAWLLIILAMAFTSYMGSQSPWNTWFAQVEFLSDRTLKRARAEKAAAD